MCDDPVVCWGRECALLCILNNAGKRVFRVYTSSQLCHSISHNGITQQHNSPTRVEKWLFAFLFACTQKFFTAPCFLTFSFSQARTDFLSFLFSPDYNTSDVFSSSGRCNHSKVVKFCLLFSRPPQHTISFDFLLLFWFNILMIWFFLLSVEWNLMIFLFIPDIFPPSRFQCTPSARPLGYRFNPANNQFFPPPDRENSLKF